MAGLGIAVALGITSSWSAASAAPIRVEFSGVIEQRTDPFSVALPLASLGNAFEGYFEFDFGSGQGSSGSVTINGLQRAVIGSPGVFVGALADDGAFLFPGRSVLVQAFATFPSFGPTPVATARDSCEFASGSVALPPIFGTSSGAGLGTFRCTAFYDTDELQFASWTGEITSLRVVPEPHLAFLAVMGLVVIRRRAS